jgi:hypothetical protein
MISYASGKPLGGLKARWPFSPHRYAPQRSSAARSLRPTRGSSQPRHPLIAPAPAPAVLGPRSGATLRDSTLPAPSAQVAAGMAPVHARLVLIQYSADPGDLCAPSYGLRCDGPSRPQLRRMGSLWRQRRSAKGPGSCNEAPVGASTNLGCSGVPAARHPAPGNNEPSMGADV